ncbi:hypothetical protein QFZ82_004034 [Streptomyces sp. V4I23]|uniref:hypothetical protein n=1 Tax=Streptomyces sp. V4I23 TaxID=3042282 RepID=UPI002784BEF1|nr:hypothetical protein [Streptomyces sp. V4I23]MDQ1009549.1 hypothetical protein [Streptomyces sp. V4I23]
MVNLREGTSAPTGSLPVPEDLIKVTEGTAKLTDLAGNTTYVDADGELKHFEIF